MTETSYNGWPASTNKSAIGVVDFAVTIAGHTYSVPGGVKGGDVALLFKHFLPRYHAYVEPLGKGSSPDEWGYSYRQNRNANNLSCHASGTAIDVNATLHPNGATRTLTDAQVKNLRSVLAFYEGVIKWGGDFSHTKDQMHYEIQGTAADVRRIANKIRAAQVPAWYKRVLQVTNPLTKGSDVLHVQERLIALKFLPAKNSRGKSNADSLYGKYTAGAVGKFQQSKHLPVTNKVDGATARALG